MYLAATYIESLGLVHEFESRCIHACITWTPIIVYLVLYITIITSGSLMYPDQIFGDSRVIRERIGLCSLFKGCVPMDYGYSGYSHALSCDIS